jgi:ribosome-associated protein
VHEGLAIPLRELRFEFARAAGSPSLSEPVRERLLALGARRIVAGGVLVISSQRFRDQGRNVADCLEKLRALLRAAAEPPRPRRPTRPTRADRERRLREKRLRSEAKRRRRGEGD